MFSGFNLTFKKWHLSEPQQDYYLKKGKELFAKYSNRVEEKLEALILANGNIDAETMKENWFPSVDADIFLSHSHKNERDAIILAGYLYDNMGVKTFIDSTIWGHSAELLRKLDNTFCKKPNGMYDYEKRNFTTANVHMMLSTALTKMIDKLECIIFLNTPDSIPFQEGVKSSTLSPWIYSEIETSKVIRHKQLSKYRTTRGVKMMCKGGKALNEAFQYPAGLDHLVDIDSEDISRWIHEHGIDDEQFPLDTLYYLTSGSTLLFK